MVISSTEMFQPDLQSEVELSIPKEEWANVCSCTRKFGGYVVIIWFLWYDGS